MEIKRPAIFLNSHEMSEFSRIQLLVRFQRLTDALYSSSWETPTLHSRNRKSPIELGVGIQFPISDFRFLISDCDLRSVLIIDLPMNYYILGSILGSVLVIDQS